MRRRVPGGAPIRKRLQEQHRKFLVRDDRLLALPIRSFDLMVLPAAAEPQQPAVLVTGRKQIAEVQSKRKLRSDLNQARRKPVGADGAKIRVALRRIRVREESVIEDVK